MLRGEGLSTAHRERASGREGFRNEKLGFKIREAQLQKIPYMLVIGDREEKEETVSPRLRSGEAMKGMRIDDFMARVESEYPSLFKRQ